MVDVDTCSSTPTTSDFGGEMVWDYCGPASQPNLVAIIPAILVPVALVFVLSIMLLMFRRRVLRVFHKWSHWRPLSRLQNMPMPPRLKRKLFPMQFMPSHDLDTLGGKFF